jgi:hypothetical protein
VWRAHPAGNEPPVLANALTALHAAAAGKDCVWLDAADERNLLRADALARESECDELEADMNALEGALLAVAADVVAAPKAIAAAPSASGAGASGTGRACPNMPTSGTLVPYDIIV